MQNVYVMDSSRWRVWAKAIAIIDLICEGIYLVVALLLTFVAGVATVVTSSEQLDHPHATEAKALTYVLWFFLVIFYIMIGVGVWAAVQLLKASRWRQDLNEAYKYSQYWMYVNIVFTVVCTILFILLGSYGEAAVSIIMRIIFMGIVFLFMKDVKEGIIATQNQQQMTQKV